MGIDIWRSSYRDVVVVWDGKQKRFCICQDSYCKKNKKPQHLSKHTSCRLGNTNQGRYRDAGVRVFPTPKMRIYICSQFPITLSTVNLRFGTVSQSATNSRTPRSPKHSSESLMDVGKRNLCCFNPVRR